MSRTVLLWTLGGLAVGLIVGALLGWLFTTSAISGDAEDVQRVFIGWLVISAIGGTLFFSLWGYANEQHRKVRRPDLFK